MKSALFGLLLGLLDARNSSLGYAICFNQDVTWGRLIEEPLMALDSKIQESLEHGLYLLKPSWNLLEVFGSLQRNAVIAADHSLKFDNPDTGICKALGNACRKVLDFCHYLMHVDFLAVQGETHRCVVMSSIPWRSLGNLISNSDPECREIKFCEKDHCLNFGSRSPFQLSEYERQTADKKSDYHSNTGADCSPGCPVYVTGRADGPAFTNAFLPTHSLIPLWIGRHFAMGRDCPQGASNA